MEKYKESYENNKFKLSGPTQNGKSELSDGSCSASDIQDCFEYLQKEQENVTDDSPIRVYINKKENRIPFKIKKK